MRKIKLDPSWEIPIVNVMLGNSREKTTQGKLVFDTGSGLTQIDVDHIEYLGYSARDALGIRSVKGAMAASLASR